MTSNLASEEIANYAQDLRREEEKKPPLINSTIAVENTNQDQQQLDDERKSRITVSKQFKDKVVKPILKVENKSQLNKKKLFFSFSFSRDIFVEMNFMDELMKWSIFYHFQKVKSTNSY